MVNQVTLIGNIGGDIELKTLEGDNSVANFSVATSSSYKDKSGEWQDQTEWHRIVAWGNQANFAHKYLSKGSKVYISGKIVTRSWDDKDGNKKYSTEIVAAQVKNLDKREDNGSAAKAQVPTNGVNDDLPF